MLDGSSHRHERWRLMPYVGVLVKWNVVINLMSALGVRNLKGYNQKVLKAIEAAAGHPINGSIMETGR